MISPAWHCGNEIDLHLRKVMIKMISQFEIFKIFQLNRFETRHDYVAIKAFCRSIFCWEMFFSVTMENVQIKVT